MRNEKLTAEVCLMASASMRATPIELPNPMMSNVRRSFLVIDLSSFWWRKSMVAQTGAARSVVQKRRLIELSP